MKKTVLKLGLAALLAANVLLMQAVVVPSSTYHVQAAEAAKAEATHVKGKIGNISQKAKTIALTPPDGSFFLLKFTDETTVSWDVNATWLGTRQWWEVAIVPADSPDVTCLWWLPCSIPAYPPGAVVVGNGHNGPNLHTDDDWDFLSWRSICNANALDPEGCASKAIRRPWTITDNQNGTLTVKFHTYTWTKPGSFPDGPFKVVFKDHNYTPNKDGIPQGYTWHWDNIAITNS